MDIATKLYLQPVIVQTEPPYWMMKPFNRYQRRQLRKAYRFFYRAHAHEKRRDGKEYYSHPKAVAKIILWDWLVHDLLVIIDALGHDSRERKTTGGFPVTRAILRKEFGEVAEADNYALTRKGHDQPKKEPKVRYMKRIVARGWRTLLVKFADRVHNLGTLQYQPQEKWQRIYDESCQYYRPLVKTLEALLPRHLKSVAARVEKSLEKALGHAQRLIQTLP
jgi:(p)ppGpp synthase/HD superfamily hydrolase